MAGGLFRTLAVLSLTARESGHIVVLRITLLGELVLRPLWIIAGVFIAVLSNYDTLFPRWEWLRGAISRLVMIELIGSLLRFMEDNWIPIILILVCIAIFEGFYRKTSKYLGDQARANIEIERPGRFQQTTRLSIPVVNHEMVDIERCFANIEHIISHQFSDHSFELPMSSINLSWEDTSEKDGYITIRGGKGRKILNLIKPDGDHFSIMYAGEPVEYSPTTQRGLDPGKYDIEIAIFGVMSGKPIEPVKQTYDMELIIIDPKDAKTPSDEENPYRMALQVKPV